MSKVIYRDKRFNVTVFGFDAGEGLTEHQAGATAIVQVLTGRLRFTVDGEELDAGPGFWLHGARYAARPGRQRADGHAAHPRRGGRGWSGGRMMVAVVERSAAVDDLDVVRRIGGLADEQHRRERSRAGDGLPRTSWRAADDRGGSGAVRDVLRERRARRAAGGDLDGVAVRPDAMVEGYPP